MTIMINSNIFLEAHPPTGTGGVVKTQGENFSGNVGQYVDFVITAKICSSGLLALEQYLGGVGYLLGTPALFKFGDKEIVVFTFSSRDFPKISAKELTEILEPHALSQEGAAQTKLLFGVIFTRWKN